MKEGESKLTVGPNIKLKGVEITDCDTLVVEGSVEATMDSRVIQISERGSFKGSAEIDIAEIRGEFDGNLTVRQKLVIYSTGKVTGRVRYGKLVIEEGGQLSGEIEFGTSAHRPRRQRRGRACKCIPRRLDRATGGGTSPCRPTAVSHRGAVPLDAGVQHLRRARAATSCALKRSRLRCSRRNPGPRSSRGCAGCRSRRRPSCPRSLSRSVVGVSQSQTWKASRRRLPARSIWACSFGSHHT